MEQFDIVISLIGVMFIGIIGVYGWTYKVSKDILRNLRDVYSDVMG